MANEATPISMPRDFLKLHCIIIVWGFTAVLGELIDLPAVQLVFYRTGIAAIALAIIIRGGARVPRRNATIFVATGTLIGIHWVLFFLSVKVANVSICMVGMATISLWTALLEPLMIRDRRLRAVDLVFGTIIVGAVYLIFRSEFEHSFGFLIAIGSAVAATIFSIINGMFAKQFNHRTIAFYEMCGACLFCALCLPLSPHLAQTGDGTGSLFTLGFDGIAWLLILALVCTVYAYSEYVELLNRLTVFTINFANNLEPVYGIILGILILHENRILGSGFYTGAAIIFLAVLAYPMINRKLGRRGMKEKT